MTEEKWDECSEYPKLVGRLRGKASDRKLLLFAAACCRRVWGLMTPPNARTAVEVTERWAEGEATEGERHTARRRVLESCEGVIRHNCLSKS